MVDPPLTRRELMDGYAHPYRTWIPIAWEHEHVPRTVALGALAALGGLIVDLTDDAGLLWLPLGLAMAAVVLLWTAWVTLSAVFIIRGHIRDWQESDHELAAVRRRRPHAGDAHPEVAHAEYAVAVGEGGELVTWRFRPLGARQDPPGHALLLTGTPRYDAVAIDSVPFDPLDAARAAEQLAEAQERAAGLERAAIARAEQGLEQAQTAAELEAESRSTAAALRGITGQSG